MTNLTSLEPLVFLKTCVFIIELLNFDQLETLNIKIDVSLRCFEVVVYHRIKITNNYVPVKCLRSWFEDFESYNTTTSKLLRETSAKYIIKSILSNLRN